MSENTNNTAHLSGALPSVTCSGTIKHHHETLLGMAKDAFDRKEFALSVILATSACEMLTERAFRLLFSYRDIDYLYDSVIERQWEYNNITKEKSRNLYISLSKDDIPHTFKGWSDLHEHYKRRHKIAHRGKKIDEKDGNKSLQIVSDYIKHIEAILKECKPDYTAKSLS